MSFQVTLSTLQSDIFYQGELQCAARPLVPKSKEMAKDTSRRFLLDASVEALVISIVKFNK